MPRLLQSFFKLRRLKQNKNNILRVAISMEEPLALQMLSASAAHTHLREIRIPFPYQSSKIILTPNFNNTLTEFIKSTRVQKLKFFLSRNLPNHISETIFNTLKLRRALDQTNNSSQDDIAGKCPAPNQLEVNLSGIGDEKLTHFTDYLKTTSTLKKIKLRADYLDSKTDYAETLEAIHQNKTLDSISINSTSLSENGLDDEHKTVLLKILNSKQLNSLNLNGHHLSDVSMQELYETLESQRKLHSLHLLSARLVSDRRLVSARHLIELPNSSIQSLSIGQKSPLSSLDYVTEQGIQYFLEGIKNNKKLKHLNMGLRDNDFLTAKFVDVIKTNKTLESITLRFSPHRPITQYTAIQLVKALNTNTSLTRFIEEQDVNGIYTKELKERNDSLLINSRIDKKTAKQIKGLLERNKLIKAIQANPNSLPHQLKKFRYATLDDTFFVTVFKVLPEPFLLKYDDLLTKLVIRSQTTWNLFKRNKYGAQRISHIISLLSRQAQAGDDVSKMTLGYIYKNGFLNQSIDPETAKDIYDSVILTSTQKEVINEARFERAHLDLVYPNCIDSRTEATNHFDKVAATGSGGTSTSIIATRLRDHCINRINGNSSLELPDEITMQTRLDNFRCLSSMATYFNTSGQNLIKMAEACTVKSEEEHPIEAQHNQGETNSYR